VSPAGSGGTGFRRGGPGPGPRRTDRSRPLLAQTRAVGSPRARVL